ncbi:uncharacterized protein A1O9_02739 [Exophiala aquamarina CBS 119918]|uniref:Uncharacterized protein n=1 Tax=Exophiala aquamarina CBS 119918 TaxID=1182545 RepID=A0A072PM55_9EURO|nr:uncharacterized protein A1O9_02739 [Exophiala aquamarina CBS 119918]KEF61174.1 hypothetical protein A1O9_02739 [Exophiala aquamarina CBS 119918]
MIPTAALIVLAIVGVICTVTMMIAIWHSVSSSLNPPEPRNDEEQKVELSSNESTARLTIVTQARSQAPEAESPPPLAAGEIHPRSTIPSTKSPKKTDSMNEIIDIYSSRGNNGAAPAKLAPPRSTTFAEAKSKWAYFGLVEDQYAL